MFLQPFSLIQLKFNAAPAYLERFNFEKLTRSKLLFYIFPDFIRLNQRHALMVF